MNYKLGILTYLAIVIAVVQSWLLLAVGLVVFFSLTYKPVFLIPMAILIDGYFGNFYTMPLLSLGTILWFVFVELIKPGMANMRSS